MQDDEFEWDDDTAEKNIEKHNVSFEIARVAFSDPDWLEFDDANPVELRYNRICRFDDALLVVTYTERGHRVRIITARRAQKNEQRAYFEQ